MKKCIPPLQSEVCWHRYYYIGSYLIHLVRELNVKARFLLVCS